MDELIDAARVPVFLLDERQVVRPGESGTAADIEKSARARGLDVYTVNLNAQYRCAGSDAYVEWVERLLGLRMGAPTEWVGDPRFAVQVAETPSALEAALAAKLAEERGWPRATAGHGAIRAQTGHWFPTSPSGTGRGRGTFEVIAR